MKITRSSTLERNLRLDIGRQFARSSGGKLDFLIRGVTIACLKEEGKVDSAMHRFMRVVIGGSKASMQDLRSLVGNMSSEQVASVLERISFLTSSSETGAKLVRGGGGNVGWMCG